MARAGGTSPRAGGTASATSGGDREPAALEDPAPFALGGTAPHPVVDAVDEGVLEAHLGFRAGAADPPGAVHADAVAREERGRWMVPAVPFGHPGGIGVVVHRVSSSVGAK